MSNERVSSETKVSGNRATIPIRIRHELGIDDGETLKWQIVDGETLRVRVVEKRSGTFDGFAGYAGDRETDAATEHDAWGVDSE